MRRFIVVALILLFGLSIASVGARPGSPGGPRLRLHRGIFDAASAAPSISALAQAAPGPYAIVQFRGPISSSDRAALERTGATILEYLPDYAYLVRGDAAHLEAVARLPHFYTQAPFTLADKLAPALLRALERGDRAVGRVTIAGWPGGDADLARTLRAATIDTQAPLDAATLLRLAGLPAVRWIEPAGRPRLLNDVARRIMNVEPAWRSRRLLGSGQIVAIADSGLDTGEAASMSPDFAGRIVASHVISAGGDLGDNLGHGTHVAGSAVGAGVQSGADPATHRYDGSFAGVAPEASMVIQAFETSPQGDVIGLGEDIYPLFAQAYADGARIHTNSWGDQTGPASDPEAAFGGYPYRSQRADAFMWDHPEMALFFAAGNSGIDGTPGPLGFCTGSDGVIDPDSLLTPATAKNVVSVGASESVQSGGLGSMPWWLLNFCFLIQPIGNDTTSDDANGMAAFSSRGPADDGRMKPDLAAPGTNIVSNRSHYPGASSLWGAHETNQHYVYSGGTSMATPLAAGAGALAREWLIGRGIAEPSAAALKSVLLNTTHDMAPGQYGGGATQEIPTARPNHVAGWGRVDLSFLDAPAPYALWVDDHGDGLATSELVTYTHTLTRPLEVTSSAQPLRVLLAWTDPPASLSAAAQLVNDLDLVVIGPGDRVYRGNNATGGDRINNVEGVIVETPPVGRYTVQVRAQHVPIASQPYALAVGGPIGVVGELNLTKSAVPARNVAPGGLITYTLTLSAGNRPIGREVTLSDTLPAQTMFVSASDGGRLNGATVQWSIPALDSNAAITRTLVVRVAGDTADGTPIVNAGYRAENGLDTPGAGPPVTVVVRRGDPSPELGEHVWLPFIRR